MIDYDQILIESSRVHRDRLAAAFVHGEQADRRPVNNNLRRLMGSVILGAVICAVCLGTGFVLNILQTQKETAALTSFQQAIAANPIPEGNGLVRDESTGYLFDTNTQQLIDPRTGFVIDPVTGFATDQQGRAIDPRTGWLVDSATGNYTDPKTGITIDPHTLQVVDPAKDESER